MSEQELKKHLASKIRQYRKKAGLSVEALQKKMRAHGFRSNLRLVENYHEGDAATYISSFTLYTAATALKIPVSRFFDGYKNDRGKDMQDLERALYTQLDGMGEALEAFSFIQKTDPKLAHDLLQTLRVLLQETEFGFGIAEDLNYHIGLRLKNAFNKQGIVQRNAAKALGISTTTLSTYATGEKSIPIYRLFILCSMLNLPISYFLYDFRSKDGTYNTDFEIADIEKDPTKQELITLFRMLVEQDPDMAKSQIAVLKASALHASQKTAKAKTAIPELNAA